MLMPTFLHSPAMYSMYSFMFGIEPNHAHHLELRAAPALREARLGQLGLGFSRSYGYSFAPDGRAERPDAHGRMLSGTVA